MWGAQPGDGVCPPPAPQPPPRRPQPLLASGGGRRLLAAAPASRAWPLASSPTGPTCAKASGVLERLSGGLPRPHAVPGRPALPTPRQAEPWEAGWDPSPRRRPRLPDVVPTPPRDAGQLRTPCPRLPPPLAQRSARDLGRAGATELSPVRVRLTHLGSLASPHPPRPRGGSVLWECKKNK